MMSMIVKNGRRMVNIMKNGVELRIVDDGKTLFISDMRDGTGTYELPSNRFEEVLQSIDNNTYSRHSHFVIICKTSTKPLEALLNKGFEL